jgi:hypothetical protein
VVDDDNIECAEVIDAMARIYAEMLISFSFNIADFQATSFDNVVQVLEILEPTFIKKKLELYYFPTMKGKIKTKNEKYLKYYHNRYKKKKLFNRFFK